MLYYHQILNSVLVLFQLAQVLSFLLLLFFEASEFMNLSFWEEKAFICGLFWQ